MFRRAYRLPFNLAGIPLYVDISFLFILPLMVWVTARNIAHIVHAPQLGLNLDPNAFQGLMPILLGLFSVLGLFACIVLHELGHSITARKYGVKVRRITLWFLGGVAEFEEMPRQRGAEAVVAIAGPLVSFALAAGFWVLTHTVPRSWPGTWIVVWYLFAVNLMLGLFNLIPAMPLDGGRILRSLLALFMSHPRATMVSGAVAKTIAILLGVWGLLTVAVAHNGQGVWTMVLAFFIFNAASRETEYSVITDTLRGITVADLMNREIVTVPAGMSVGQLGHYIILHHHKGFPVVDDIGRLIGTIGVEQMREVNPGTPVWQVMSTEIQTIPHRASALDAFKQLSGENSGRLIVTDDAGGMVGILTRADLLRAIEIRMLGLPVGQQWTPSPVFIQRPPSSVPPPSSQHVPVGYTPPPLPPPLPGHAAPGQPGYNPANDETGNSERYARPL